VTSPSDADSGAAAGPPTTPQPRPRWWLAVAIFVAGLVVGVLTVALLFSTTPDFGAVEGQAPDRPVPSRAASVPVVAEAWVNAACLRVINEAQDVYRILSGVDEAAADVDLQRLDDIVRRLQPLEPRLERDLQACRVDTRVAGGPSAPPGSPPPTVPQPTPS
jgi:hypothetical protein